MIQVQGSSRKRREEQQDTGQEAWLQTKPQCRSEVHPGDGDRGRTRDKLPTTKVQGPFRKQGPDPSPKYPWHFQCWSQLPKYFCCPLVFCYADFISTLLCPSWCRWELLIPMLRKEKLRLEARVVFILLDFQKIHDIQKLQRARKVLLTSDDQLWTSSSVQSSRSSSYESPF